MIIYPAIDLRHGRCVRLRQGDPSAETVFSDDPASMARHWASQGAEWLHVVNLDGALGAARQQSALPVNLERLREIAESVSIPVQFGGGLRSIEDIRLAVQLGAQRVVLGTVAVENPVLVSEAVARYGSQRIVVGLDARDGKVATHGWQSTSQIDAVELGHEMHAMGVRRVLYTDISRDGMLSGVNVEATARLGDITGLSVIASGGVAGIRDIELLKAHEHYNIDGVVIGQALYTGNLDLSQAIEVGNRPLERRSAGIVPYRHTDNGLEFLLIFNLFFEQWQFPRGGVELAESDLACAKREFQEETGLHIIQLHDECRIDLHYTAKVRDYSIERTVIYYPAKVELGEIRFGHENHCEARWVSYDEAFELLAETGPEQLPALDGALSFLQGQPLT